MPGAPWLQPCAEAVPGAGTLGLAGWHPTFPRPWVRHCMLFSHALIGADSMLLLLPHQAAAVMQVQPACPWPWPCCRSCSCPCDQHVCLHTTLCLSVLTRCLLQPWASPLLLAAGEPHLLPLPMLQCCVTCHAAPWTNRSPVACSLRESSPDAPRCLQPPEPS